MSLIVGIFIGRYRRFCMEHIIERFLRKGVQVECRIIFYTFILCKILRPIEWLLCRGRTMSCCRCFLRNLFSRNSNTQNLKIRLFFMQNSTRYLFYYIVKYLFVISLFIFQIMRLFNYYLYA